VTPEISLTVKKLFFVETERDRVLPVNYLHLIYIKLLKKNTVVKETNVRLHAYFHHS
jgi:hypothetical protein